MRTHGSLFRRYRWDNRFSRRTDSSLVCTWCRGHSAGGPLCSKRSPSRRRSPRNLSPRRKSLATGHYFEDLERSLKSHKFYLQ